MSDCVECPHCGGTIRLEVERRVKVTPVSPPRRQLGLHEARPRVVPRAPKWEMAAVMVAEQHGLTMDDLRARDRRRSVNIARAAAMRAARNAGGSLREVGDLFERDRSTVVAATRAA